MAPAASPNAKHNGASGVVDQAAASMDTEHSDKPTDTTIYPMSILTSEAPNDPLTTSDQPVGNADQGSSNATMPQRTGIATAQTRPSHAAAKAPIFNNVRYWLNPFMTKGLRTKLEQLLETHGGSAASCAEDEEEDRVFNARFSLSQTTHCISPDADFCEYEEATARGIHVVTPDWIHRAVRNGYLHKPEYYSPLSDSFLSGVVVATTQIPAVDRDAIFGAVEAFGGQWRERMVKEVTHLITVSANGPRYESAMQHPELGIKVVLIHWLDDCFRLRRRVPEHRYLFPDPAILRENPWMGGDAQVDVAVEAVKATDVANRDPLAYELGQLAVESSKDFLTGYRVYLGDDLSIVDATRTSLRERIRMAGGQLCSDYSPDGVDIVICRWRTSPAYRRAIVDGKSVGTLNWLFNMLLTGRLESSSHQLLYYPSPKHGIPGMRSMIITVSNYCGMAREYIKRLIVLSGAEYTADMSRRNTHIICGGPYGAKYEAAADWQVAVVNHLWLEESYRSWECQSVTRPHFTHFPCGEGLLEIVGQTGYRPSDLRPWLERARLSQADTPTEAAAQEPAVDTIVESDQEENDPSTATTSPLSLYHQRRSAMKANARLAVMVQSMNEYEKELRRVLRQRALSKRHPPPQSTPATPPSKSRPREQSAIPTGMKRVDSKRPADQAIPSTATADSEHSKRPKISRGRHTSIVISDDEEETKKESHGQKPQPATASIQNTLQKSASHPAHTHTKDAI